MPLLRVFSLPGGKSSYHFRLLYMDKRLVNHKDMRENVLRAFHFGHAGRDAMLREASDIWWPRVHRDFVEKAKNCMQSQQAGKNLKCLKS